MWSVSTHIEDALWDAVRDELGPGALTAGPLDAAIIARSHLYTDERERLGASVAPAKRSADLAARALFFTVADAAKIHVPLAELIGRDLLPARRLRVLDVGAGAGAMTFGLLDALPGRLAEVTALDRDGQALAIFRRAATALAPELRLVTHVRDALQLPEEEFDVVVAGSLLNELAAPRRLELARALVARVAADGALILIEPALRETARSLHEVRDMVLGENLAHVFAPCTRQGPCPALKDPRDWCHEDRPFQPPRRLAELIRRTGLRGMAMKLAYLTLRKAPDPLVQGRRVLRVVSGPLDSKGTVERLVCGSEGRIRLRLLRRHQNTALRELASAHRGDVLLDDGDLKRVETATPAAFPEAYRR